MTRTTVQAPLRFAEIQQEIKKRRRKSFAGSFRHILGGGGCSSAFIMEVQGDFYV